MAKFYLVVLDYNNDTSEFLLNKKTPQIGEFFIGRFFYKIFIRSTVNEKPTIPPAITSLKR